MTKALGAVALAVLALLLLPSAVAHGAPPVREVDTRVLLDDDGTLGYNGGGLDVLALDVREAAFADGTPAIVFRLLVQSEAAPAGQALTLSFTAADAAKTFTATTEDGAAYTSADFDRIDGPFDVGDGHPKGIDAWVTYASAGVTIGGTLTDVSMSSVRGDALDDLMPGGWVMQGVEVPTLPPSAAETAPASYTLQGPAQLLKVEATPGQVDAPGQVTLRITNQVALPQFVSLAIELPDGATARLEQAAVSLDPSGARDVTLVISSAPADGVLRVVAVSDLGAYTTIDVPMVAPAPVPTPSATGAPHDGEGEHGHDESKDSPTPLLALPALAIALLLSRRLLK